MRYIESVIQRITRKKTFVSLFFFSFLFSFSLFPAIVLAADCTSPTVDFEIAIGDSTSADGLLDYLAILYEFIVASIGLIAVVVIMYWGFRWVTALGNQTIIGNAKEGIKGALMGIVIALTSYSLLFFINSSYTSFADICPTGFEADAYSTGWEQCSTPLSVASQECATHEYCKTADGCSCEKVLDSVASFCLPLANKSLTSGSRCQSTDNCVTPLICAGGSAAKAGTCLQLNDNQSCTQDTTICTYPLICTHVNDIEKRCLLATGRSDGQYCEKDAQCSSLACGELQQRCVTGGEGSACLADQECLWGYRCASGGCVPKVVGDSCDEENGCSTGLACIFNDGGLGGTCLAGNAGDSCDDDGDCSAAAPYCIDAGAYGSICSTGDAGTACDTNEDCGDSAPYCVDRNAKWGSECFEGRQWDKCDDNDDCLNKSCHLTAYYCVEEGEQVYCESSADCPSEFPYCVGNKCFDGTRRDSCASDADCVDASDSPYQPSLCVRGECNS